MQSLSHAGTAPGFVLQGGNRQYRAPPCTPQGVNAPSCSTFSHPLQTPLVPWCTQWVSLCRTLPDSCVSNSLCCSTNSLGYNALSAEGSLTAPHHHTRAMCGTRTVLFRGCLKEARLAGAAGTRLSHLVDCTCLLWSPVIHTESSSCRLNFMSNTGGCRAPFLHISVSEIGRY